MKRKMDLLERAHGLLCNVPSDNTSAEQGEEWNKLRADWIRRWEHLIADQQTKEHNARVAVGNEAITDYQERERVGWKHDDGPRKIRINPLTYGVEPS
jgi:hypothetical protein